MDGVVTFFFIINRLDRRRKKQLARTEMNDLSLSIITDGGSRHGTSFIGNLAN